MLEATLGPHATFIVVSYAATAVVIAAMIGWVLRDHARQRRTLADLEARGIKRRSQKSE